MTDRFHPDLVDKWPSTNERHNALLIHCWALLADPYAAPELRKRSLTGVCPNHPRKGQLDKVIYTSSIVRASGRYVQTKSGSLYRLGRIESTYRKFLRSEGLPYDPRNPIGRIITKRSAPPKPDPKGCKKVDGAHVMPGWGCCKCRTYNGLQRSRCKSCAHECCFAPEGEAINTTETKT